MSNTLPAGSDDSALTEAAVTTATDKQEKAYQLDQQIGYLLRLANQRHLEIFTSLMPQLTPTQFSVLRRLDEVGELSQNELGRRVGMDAATTNGVVDRLGRKELIASNTDVNDKRRLLISLTSKGRKTARQALGAAHEITAQTLRNLNDREARQLKKLLLKLQDE